MSRWSRRSRARASRPTGCSARRPRPSSRFLNLVRVNAAPLPGFTNWNSMTVYGFPSIRTLRPLRISDVSYMARHVYPAPSGLSNRDSPSTSLDASRRLPCRSPCAIQHRDGRCGALPPPAARSGARSSSPSAAPAALVRYRGRTDRGPERRPSDADARRSTRRSTRRCPHGTDRRSASVRARALPARQEAGRVVPRSHHDRPHAEQRRRHRRPLGVAAARLRPPRWRRLGRRRCRLEERQLAARHRRSSRAASSAVTRGAVLRLGDVDLTFYRRERSVRRARRR